MKQSLPAGPGTVTVSVSLRDHLFDLPEENGFVPGKLAVHGKHVSDTEIWAGSAGGKLFAGVWHAMNCFHPLCAPGWLCFAGSRSGRFLSPFLLRAKTWLRCRPPPACPFSSPSPAEVLPRHQRQGLAAPGFGDGADAIRSNLPGPGGGCKLWDGAFSLPQPTALGWS